MVLKMINDKIKEQMRTQQRDFSRNEFEQQEAQELNQLIKKVTLRDPQANYNEKPSNLSEISETTKTVSNK